MKTKTFDTNERTLLIDDIKTFIETLIDLKTNKSEKNYLLLIDIMKPTLKLWSAELSNKSMYQVFTIYSLCRMLDSDDRPIGKAKDKLKN